MAGKKGKVSAAAYTHLTSAADRVHRTPMKAGVNQKTNRKQTAQPTFPVILLGSLGEPIVPASPGGAKVDLRERALFSRLIDTGSSQTKIFQMLIEDDCIVTVGGFILTATITADTTEQELYVLLQEATATTGIQYASAIVAQNLFIRELIPSGTDFQVTSVTPASSTTAANDMKVVSWWPQKTEEECSLAWEVSTAIEGGSIMLAADAGERGIVVVPPLSGGGGTTTINNTSTCCECTVITTSDLSINGVATTSRWDVELTRDATYIFDTGYIVVNEGTYRITWAESYGGWWRPLYTTQHLGSSVFIYLTDGTDVSTDADIIDIDVVVDIVQLRFLLVPDNGSQRTQLQLEVDVTVDDNRP